MGKSSDHKHIFRQDFSRAGIRKAGKKYYRCSERTAGKAGIQKREYTALLSFKLSESFFLRAPMMQRG